MKHREVEVDVEGLISRRPRTPGLHYSTIAKHLLRNWDPERFGRKPKTGLADRFLVGFVFEELMTQALAQIVREHCQLPQLEVTAEMAGRPIILTIDAFDPRLWLVYESKATWMSSRRPITDRRFWHYFVQVKAYCKAAQTTDAELWVLFVRGDYGEDWRPVLKRWRLWFTKAELEENWKMLENSLRDLIARGMVDAAD